MNRNIHYIYILALLLLFGAATPAIAQTIKGNVYGGGQLGKVAGNTSITIESGKVETGTSGGSNIFGGGFEAEVAGNTTITINDGEAGNVYGGGEAANIVVGAEDTGKTVVNINGGTVHHSVYGGGLGNTTNVATSTTVTANSGTVTEDVYGGSGFGTVGATTVIINNGATVTRDVFGGGFGSTSLSYEADVNGNASVTINKGAVISGNVYGGNNTNGSPKGAITVLVDGPVDATEKESTPLELKDVFGGGKNAATISSSNYIPAPKVTIKGCETVIARVFGGGDAASAPATDVEIWGGHITNAFAGGNGENVAAHVGYLADGTTAYTYGSGNTNITIKGGVIENVFGGSNTAGNIRGEVSVTVEKDDLACDMQISNLYGGGNEAPGKAGTISIVCTGDGRIENVYGGANKADITGDITLNIKGGQITNVFGGNNNSGNINGAITVNVNWDTEACGRNSLDNVYGGGNKADYTGSPAVNIINGTVNYNVFGGGLEAIVTGNPSVTVNGGTVTLGAYGGGALADVNGNTNVNIISGTVGNAYGGGLGSADVAAKVVNTSVRVTGGFVDNVFGCNNTNGSPTGTVNVEIAGGTVNNNVYGGGNLADAGTTENHVNPVVTVSSGTVTHDVYGGGALADVTGNTTVNLTGGAVGGAYGGALGQLASAADPEHGIPAKEAIAALVNGNTQVNLGAMVDDGDGNLTPTGNATVSNIFGCNNLNGGPNGTATVNVISGTVSQNVYGGGNQAAASVSPSVNITGGTVTESVYGGGYGATAIITGNPAVVVSGGIVTENVFGGGSLAETNGATSVTVSGGTVTKDVYGGGALADVDGNTTVNLTGGAVGGAYGGALGSAEVAAKVYGDTYVHLDGSKVTETGIFGANNLNGTPTGHVKVHVTKTMPRDGQGAEEYDVPAVYGGGNLSAYEPDDDNDYAEVLIENCENSINYVYGGGNAAPVPATQVTIYGANAINYAFAGGNGFGADNPGADVGYKGYYSKGSREEYGTGETHIRIYGGTINHVFGGSNTLGYIRTHAYVEVLNIPDDDTEHKDNICELHLGEVQAGGNEAEMYCGGSVTLACSEGAEVVYAGSSDADIHGDINLVITSGTYGKVFGGNNHSGNVYGGITINIDETGCWPVMIGELYACGNEAPYSIYGYNDNGSCKTSGEPQYTDPTINLISFTRIGKVFGGGYGNTAVAYGNPTVNVEPIKGIFAGKKPTPIYVLNDRDQRALLSETDKLPYGITKEGSNLVIPDEAGSIGTIYGGGNAGAVYGNTNVKIGTKTTNKHVSGTDKTTEYDVAVTITGNVFGGGNEAIVSGDTNVTIGK